MGRDPELGETDSATGDSEHALLDVLSALVPADPAGARDQLGRLTEGAAALSSVSGGGAMWNLDGRLRHVTATDSFLCGLQRQQERNQSGPSVDAFKRNVTIRVANVRSAMTGKPVAIAAIPLGRPEHALGVLTVWNGANWAWSENDLVALGVMAELAGSRLARQEEYELLSRTSRELQHALDARVLVEQAKGVVAAERGVTVERALALLKRYARDRGRSLKSVAADVVAGRVQP